MCECVFLIIFIFNGGHKLEAIFELFILLNGAQ